MKLPNAHLAVVDRDKVLDYLLNEAHPDNGGKARFFTLLGFSREDPERLMKTLRDVAEHGEVVSSGESIHGEKYVVGTTTRDCVSWDEGVTIRHDQGARQSRSNRARTC